VLINSAHLHQEQDVQHTAINAAL